MRLETGSSVLAVLVVLSVVTVSGVGAPAVAASSDQCSFPVTKTDAMGTEVTVEEEPDRVVTLNPSAAQTMWEIGAKDKVVGVSKYAAYLEGASSKTNVSGPGGTTVVPEKVVALEPDLVLAPNTIDDEMVQKLRDNGLTVYKFRAADSLDFIVQKTRLTGELVGECDGAEETATWMDQQLRVIRDAVEGQDGPRVLYTFGGGYSAGKETFINTAIETAGGKNVAAEKFSGYNPISEETIVDEDPQWIVRNTYEPEVPETDAYNQTTAVKEGNVLVINTNLINQPAPRIIYPIRKMVQTFHPQAYNESLEELNSTGTAEVQAGTATDTSTNVPGMGPAVATVALLAVALFARRR
jgi:iron complex transport system substrate-binding protein